VVCKSVVFHLLLHPVRERDGDRVCSYGRLCYFRMMREIGIGKLSLEALNQLQMSEGWYSLLQMVEWLSERVGRGMGYLWDIRGS